jgi:hypothetical protein
MAGKFISTGFTTGTVRRFESFAIAPELLNAKAATIMNNWREVIFTCIGFLQK